MTFTFLSPYHYSSYWSHLSPVLTKWNQMYREASRKMSRSFTVVSDDLQRKGIEGAGFADVTVVNRKVRFRRDLLKHSGVNLHVQLPIGGWARNPASRRSGASRWWRWRLIWKVRNDMRDDWPRTETEVEHRSHVLHMAQHLGVAARRLSRVSRGHENRPAQ